MMIQSEEAERIAKRFHSEYEKRAPLHGWSTQVESRKEWEEVPEENRELMVDTVEALLTSGVIIAGKAP